MNFPLYAYDLGVVYESGKVSNVMSRLGSKCSTEQLVRFQHEVSVTKPRANIRINHTCTLTVLKPPN